MQKNDLADSIVRFLDYPTEQFIIPNYQRRYAWENKQVLDLFYDIHFLNIDQTHLLNMTIVIPSEVGRGFSETQIVDGQQRITTLMLLIKVLSEKYKSFNKEVGYDHLQDMQKCLYAQRQCDKKIKLKLGELDRKDFKNIIEEVASPDDNGNTKLRNAYFLLKNELKDFSHSEVLEFWQKLQNQIKIIRYSFKNSGEAYKLFEITNNRGLDLTKTDIIKNFVLGHIAIIVEKPNEEDKRINNVLKKWQEIIINLDGIKKDEFFRHFLMGRTCKKIPFSRLIEKFKDYYFLNVKDVELLTEFQRYKYKHNILKSTQRKPIEKFLDDLIISSKVYRQIVFNGFENNDLNKEIENLNKIEATPAYTFLLFLFTKIEKDVNQKIVVVIKVLQTFMVRRHICKYQTGELDDIFSKLCDVNTNQIDLNVREKLQKDLPDNKKFEEMFPEHDYKGKVNRAKYILEQIEYKINPPAETKIDWDKVHLEHIVPQKITTKTSKYEFGDWEKYLGKEAEKHGEFLNKIGNLTLLHDKLNINASNNPFKEKKINYKASKIELTKELNAYRFFKIKNINSRSCVLAKRALEIWRF